MPMMTDVLLIITKAPKSDLFLKLYSSANKMRSFYYSYSVIINVYPGGVWICDHYAFVIVLF